MFIKFHFVWRRISVTQSSFSLFKVFEILVRVTTSKENLRVLNSNLRLLKPLRGLSIGKLFYTYKNSNYQIYQIQKQKCNRFSKDIQDSEDSICFNSKTNNFNLQT